MSRAVADLAALLGLTLTDESLARTALTHPSRSSEPSYQRLEFVGDRVVGLAVAGWLYDRFPEEPEGQLNRRLSGLVRTESLAAIAKEIGLAPLIRLEAGAAREEAHLKPTVLADVMEAVIGAVYKDQGFDAARDLVVRLMEGRLQAGARVPKDAKTALQEWAQGRGLPLPRYELADRAGPDHAPRFCVRVAVGPQERAEGEGTSKRQAEQAAARALLDRLGVSA